MALILLLITSAHAQVPSEAAFIRGHFSNGSGTWSFQDFGWFYYDLDKELGGEQLKVDVDGRRIERGGAIYSSKVWSEEFKYKRWGMYDSISFLGKRYLAGYPESRLTDAVSALGKGELREILIDDKEAHILTYNQSLPLLDGYVLAVEEVSSSSDAVLLVLLKNKIPVHTAVVSEGGDFLFKQGDLPIILAHVSSAMGDKSLGVVEVDGVFQVRDLPAWRFTEGDKLGNLELKDLNSRGLSLETDKVLSLTADSTVLLGGDLMLAVIKDPRLIYYPVGAVTDYGQQEVRGPAFSKGSAIPVMYGDAASAAEARWNYANFSGFYLDPEREIGTETLTLYRTAGREIRYIRRPEKVNNTLVIDGMQYNSLVQEREFEYRPWGRHRVVSLFGELWFAGYGQRTSPEIGGKGLLEYQRLSRILLDSDKANIANAGSAFKLAEGYEFLILDLNNEKLFAQLLKDGKAIDSTVIQSNSTYIYKKTLGDVADFPLIAIHIQNLFSDGARNLAVVDGIFQVSEFILPMEVSRDFGKLKVLASNPQFIVMGNPSTINLGQDTSVAIWPGLNIRVADNDTLRYYLYTMRYVVPRPMLTGIDYPRNVTQYVQANFTMAALAAEIVRVSAEIIDPSGRTVYARDLTKDGVGAGDRWTYSWRWDATSLALSDDLSLVIDLDQAPVPALLYLNNSTAVGVGVAFDRTGRVASIADGKVVYYLSRYGYNLTKRPGSYEDMLANETARRGWIEPGKSLLRFYDIANGTTKLTEHNHTITGSLEALEPHVERTAAKPGRYELRLRIENAVDALRVGGILFNVTPRGMPTVSLGSSAVRAGDKAEILLEVPSTKAEKRIQIAYDPAAVRALGASGPVPSYIDQEAGRISVVLPPECTSANLTFLASWTDRGNATVGLEVVKVEGLQPEKVINGSIIVISERAESKKSSGPAFIAGIAVFALAGAARRRIRPPQFLSLRS
jgi:S-layer protein (TIGR01567 family)